MQALHETIAGSGRSEDAGVPPRSEPQAGLGYAIRQIRLARGLAQETLAHAADTHPTWISHLESGRNNPSWGTVRRICAVLDVTVADLAALADQIDAEARDEAC
jgi:transcriptional regulator with XRE-family HTH domain